MSVGQARAARGGLGALMILTRHLLEWTSLAALAGLVLIAAGFAVLPILYALQRGRPQPAAPTSDEAEPRVLVQLPVFNEPQLVAELLDNVAALDWPRDKLHVQLLDDSTDETGEIAVVKIEELRAAGLSIEHQQRHHRGFKAGALAAGLVQCDAPLVAILDADFRPPADWLRRVVPRLLADPTAAFIQSRCEFVNADQNWLTRAQGLLFDAHFVLEHGVRARAGRLIQFNGTAGIWRRAAIDAAGGWSGDTLLEDLDLTLRAALAGWRGVYASEPPVGGLVPHELTDWRVQQRRWSMGFAQNARSATASIWGSDWGIGAKLSASFTLLYQIVALPLVVMALTAALLTLAMGGPDLPYVWPAWGVVVALVPVFAVGMTLPPYLELNRGGFGRYFVSLLAIPPLIVLLSFANAGAILAGCFGGVAYFDRTPKPHWRAAKSAATQVAGDA
jgi:cellulose synthase/poly-beta-1,6-N-acetylglucosamine synthase-like glycosyltransferase